jgi:hypothetical protein
MIPCWRRDPYILNPRYVVRRASWWRALLGWHWQVVWCYAVEVENHCMRWAEQRVVHRGYFRTLVAATARKEALDASPEYGPIR